MKPPIYHDFNTTPNPFFCQQRDQFAKTLTVNFDRFLQKGQMKK